uniref:Uncharacterized protein n=1 Tax=Anopheles farauti TaxID=69004 RepID=A0A182QG88_9DIPT
MKALQTCFCLLIVLTAVCLAEKRVHRDRRELRYRPNVAYAYQYRTDQFASVKKTPVLPVASVHLQNQLLKQVQPSPVPAKVLHFPTRRPMQAIDRLHTRVDIGQHRRSALVGVVPVVPIVPVVPVSVATIPGTVVAHSHTEVYRKYR